MKDGARKIGVSAFERRYKYLKDRIEADAKELDALKPLLKEYVTKRHRQNGDNVARLEKLSERIDELIAHTKTITETS